MPLDSGLCHLATPNHYLCQYVLCRHNVLIVSPGHRLVGLPAGRLVSSSGRIYANSHVGKTKILLLQCTPRPYVHRSFHGSASSVQVHVSAYLVQYNGGSDVQVVAASCCHGCACNEWACEHIHCCTLLSVMLNDLLLYTFPHRHDEVICRLVAVVTMYMITL